MTVYTPNTWTGYAGGRGPLGLAARMALAPLFVRVLTLLGAWFFAFFHVALSARLNVSFRALLVFLLRLRPRERR